MYTNSERGAPLTVSVHGSEGEEEEEEEGGKKLNSEIQTVKGISFLWREPCGAKLNEPISFKSAMVNAVNM